MKSELRAKYSYKFLYCTWDEELKSSLQSKLLPKTIIPYDKFCTNVIYSQLETTSKSEASNFVLFLVKDAWLKNSY